MKTRIAFLALVSFLIAPNLWAQSRPAHEAVTKEKIAQERADFTAHLKQERDTLSAHIKQERADLKAHMLKEKADFKTTMAEDKAALKAQKAEASAKASETTDKKPTD